MPFCIMPVLFLWFLNCVFVMCHKVYLSSLRVFAAFSQIGCASLGVLNTWHACDLSWHLDNRML